MGRNFAPEKHSGQPEARNGEAFGGRQEVLLWGSAPRNRNCIFRILQNAIGKEFCQVSNHF